jgi:hypothetical protein
MDRPDVYGEVVHTLSFAEAARRGIICDYKVVISVVTSEMLNDYVLKHGEVIVAGDAVKARQVALQIALQKAVEKYGVSRIFTFHGSVAAARSFTSGDGEGIRHHLDGFQTLHVSGAMPTSLREDYMRAFRQAEKAVISNARCLTEGVDVPAVDMVAFMSPRKSKVDIVQATGRAMRKSPGKQHGYVMVPLFLDMTANETIEEALHRTDFSDVWDVLSAMKEQDDVLTDIIRQMREDKGRTGGYNESRLRERVEVLGPSVSLEAIRNSITAVCVEGLGASWDERYGELLAYKAEHGDTNVPVNWKTGLGQWVSGQRKAKRKGELSIEKVNRLTETDFIWDALEWTWNESFTELLAYKEKHGDTNVPQSWPTGLGSWVSDTRKDWKNGSLSEERVKRLTEIGFEWTPRHSSWESMFAELLAYKEKCGDTNVTRRTILGRWVSGQRSAKRKGSLSEERIHKLNEVGFDWDWNFVIARWETLFGELLAYKAEHGDTNVPVNWKTGLGQWVSHQRSDKNDGSLLEDRIRRLDEIGFEWDSYGTHWDNWFRELLTYKAEHGDTNVPARCGNGLGSWVSNQRQRKKLGALSEENIQRLDGIGFYWGASISKLGWEARFRELCEYQTKHGDLNVPQRFPTGLGRWISMQRKLKKDGTHLEDRIRRLNEIGFVWDALEWTWEESFTELFAYKEKHGDTNVPQSWPTGLGSWVSHQRSNKSNGTLSVERMQRLDEIGFEWNPMKKLKSRAAI